jgi:hypothetical protein
VYQALLEEMVAFHQQRGWGLLQPPVTEERLDALRARALAELGYTVPDAYVALLRRTDGLDFNGLCLLASDRQPIVGHTDRFLPGFVDNNLDWRGNIESMAHQVVFAFDGMTNFVFNQRTSAWEIRWMPSDDLGETVDCFERLILRALEDHRPPP